MRIIKEGKIPKETKTVECGYCGCVFEVEKGEYEYTSYIAQWHDGAKPYYCKCPCCKYEVEFD